MGRKSKHQKEVEKLEKEYAEKRKNNGTEYPKLGIVESYSVKDISAGNSTISPNTGPQGWCSEEYVSLNEPYQYKGENVELIKDKPSQPLEPSYAVRGFWGVSSPEKETPKMEIHFEYQSIDDGLENVLPEYVDLIKQMRIAKHKNEIICAEIEDKHNSFLQSLNRH